MEVRKDKSFNNYFLNLIRPKFVEEASLLSLCYCIYLIPSSDSIELAADQHSGGKITTPKID